MSYREVESVLSNSSLMNSLIPERLMDSHQTHMKSMVLILTLLANSVICLLFLPFLIFGFDKTPIIQEGGMQLIGFALFTFAFSFLIFNRFGMLIAAGNIAQVGIYIAGVITTWQTGGIFSPMLFLLLIPPVFAFVLANLTSGLFWAVVVILTFIGIWGVEELAFAYPEGINGFIFPASEMVIIDQADFARLCLIIPLLSCVSIIGVVAIYEMNSIRLNKLLSQERNMFAFKASHDPLTGLANREEFDLKIRMAIETAHHSSFSLALVYIDLDGFKPINDTLGHHAGDVVLEVVSARLENIVRGTDTVARLGGDEFAIILQGVSDEKQIRPILEKILGAISQDIKVDEDTMVSVKGSLGVAFYPQDSNGADQLCRHADMAMYLAKEDKNTWRFFREIERNQG